MTEIEWGSFVLGMMVGVFFAAVAKIRGYF